MPFTIPQDGSSRATPQHHRNTFGNYGSMTAVPNGTNELPVNQELATKQTRNHVTLHDIASLKQSVSTIELIEDSSHCEREEESNGLRENGKTRTLPAPDSKLTCNLLYGLTDKPPLHLSILLGLQVFKNVFPRIKGTSGYGNKSIF